MNRSLQTTHDNWYIVGNDPRVVPFSIVKEQIKKTTASAVAFHLPGGDLLCQDPAVQVPSTLESLTSVFGMGTGVASPSLPPDVRITISFAFRRQSSLSRAHVCLYAPPVPVSPS